MAADLRRNGEDATRALSTVSMWRGLERSPFRVNDLDDAGPVASDARFSRPLRSSKAVCRGALFASDRCSGTGAING